MKETLHINNLLSGLDTAVFKSIRDPFGIFDLNHKMLWINKAMAAIYQCEPKNVIGKVCYESFKKRNTPCPGCPLEKVHQTGRTYVTEEWHDFPDGKRRWGEVRTYPVRGNNKQVLAVIVIIIDITQKKEILRHQINYSEFLSEKLDESRKKNQKVKLDGDNIKLMVHLSRREAEVLRLLTEGHTNSQISDLLSISHHTVKSHVNHIFNKLGVNDRTQAAVIATRHNLV